jgi:hypothetical protein
MYNNNGLPLVTSSTTTISVFSLSRYVRRDTLTLFLTATSIPPPV